MPHSYNLSIMADVKDVIIIILLIVFVIACGFLAYFVVEYYNFNHNCKVSDKCKKNCGCVCSISNCTASTTATS